MNDKKIARRASSPDSLADQHFGYNYNPKDEMRCFGQLSFAKLARFIEKPGFTVVFDKLTKIPQRIDFTGINGNQRVAKIEFAEGIDEILSPDQMRMIENKINHMTMAFLIADAISNP